MMASRTETVMGSLFAALIVCGIPSASQAGSFVANFTCKYDLGRAVYPSYFPAGQANGFTYSFGKGSLSISQAAGVGNAQLELLSSFSTSGDFTTSVVVSRPKLGSAELGIQIADQFGNDLMDIFYQNNTNGFQGITSNVDSGGPNSSLISTQSSSDSSTTTTLTISRTGNVLSAGYNDGSGFVALNSSANNTVYGVPVVFGLFLDEEFGDIGAHQGNFSDLNVSAPSLGKTCTSPGL